MEESKRLPINMDELIQAMTDNMEGSEYFLDLDTGEVIWRNTWDSFQDEEDLEAEELDKRNLKLIEPTPSYEAYEDMVDFARTVEDEALSEKLRIALDGKGAFRRFKNVLLDYPDERERWFEFRDGRDHQRALDFLYSLKIEPLEPDAEVPQGEP